MQPKLYPTGHRDKLQFERYKHVRIASGSFQTFEKSCQHIILTATPTGNALFLISKLVFAVKSISQFALDSYLDLVLCLNMYS